MIDLKVERALHGHISQEELALATGLTRVTISNVERGKRPSIRVAQTIARVLELDWRDFYEA